MVVLPWRLARRGRDGAAVVRLDTAVSTAEQPAGERKGRMVGRFEMFEAIATGGFAAIHIGRTVNTDGFSKRVAIKRLHSAFVEDVEIRTMFLDEARVVARIQHPNVVPTMDFIEEGGELFMVMEYVEGITLGQLLHDVRKIKKRIPLDIVARIVSGTLSGLHAAHEAQSADGEPLCVIHRDVSPENILVGTDGFARILDFGVARAMGRYQATQAGQVKGTIAYMTPEQVMGVKNLTRRSDVFAASAVMWECITGRTLFEGDNPGELALKVAQQVIEPPTVYTPDLPATVSQVVMRGLERDPDKRWKTAEQMAEAIEAVGKVASPVRMGKWLRRAASERLAERAQKVVDIEATMRGDSESSQSSEGETAYKASTTQVLRLKPQSKRQPEDRPEVTDKVSIAARHRSEATASSPGVPPSHRGAPPPVSQPGVVVSQPGAAPPSQPGVVLDDSDSIDIDLGGVSDPATPVPTSVSGGVARPSDPFAAAPPAEASSPSALLGAAQPLVDDVAGPSSHKSDTIAPGKPQGSKAAWGVGAAIVGLAAVVGAAVVTLGPSSDDPSETASEAEPASPPAAAVATEKAPSGDVPEAPPEEAQAEPPPAQPASPVVPVAKPVETPPDPDPQPVAEAPPADEPPDQPVATAAVPTSPPDAPPAKPWTPPPRKPKPKPQEDDLFGRK